MGTRRIDERDIMFSRYLLEPGSHRFETYYREQPDKRGADDRFRALPGVLATDASASDPVLFGAARASFEVVKHMPYNYVVIFDDVVTTGSTVNELAHVLKRAGVERVDVWSIARAG